MSATEALVESRMGAVAWGLWPTLRFPSPLIKPNVPISGIRLSDWFHREAHGEQTNRTRLRHGERLAFAPRHSSFGQRLPLMVFSGSSPITITSPSSKAHQKSGSFPSPALPGFKELVFSQFPLTLLVIRRQPEPRRWPPAATGQLATCAREPQSLSCAFCRRSLFVSDTTGSMRCPSGKAKSAKPVGSSRGVRVRYPPWRAPSLAACCRSHLGRQ